MNVSADLHGVTYHKNSSETVGTGFQFQYRLGPNSVRVFQPGIVLKKPFLQFRDVGPFHHGTSMLELELNNRSGRYDPRRHMDFIFRGLA